MHPKILLPSEETLNSFCGRVHTIGTAITVQQYLFIAKAGAVIPAQTWPFLGSIFLYYHK
jgi:hypothetical protein